MRKIDHNVIKKQLITLSTIFLLGLVVVGAQTEYQTYYKINLNYVDEVMNVDSIDIEFSLEKFENSFGFWSAEILNYKGELLNTSFFDVPNKIDLPIEESFEEEGSLDRNSFEIYLPYYENAKEIVIYNEFLDEVARISVEEYSKERGIIKKPLEQEQVEEKEEIKFRFEEEKFGEKSLTEKLAGYWWIFILVFVVLIIVLLYSLKKKK